MVGHRVWAIPEGYIPGRSFSQKPELLSHRLDSRDQHIALLSTLAFPDEP